MKRRLQGIVIGTVVGAVFAGTVAYAVTVVPPNDGDVYYGCFSIAGKLKASTVLFNAEPATCPSATDVVRSWGAKGDDGPAGAVGPQGPEGPEGQAGSFGVPGVRVIDLSAAAEHQDVVIDLFDEHYYPAFDSSDCRSIAVSAEDVTGELAAAWFLYTGHSGADSTAVFHHVASRPFVNNAFTAPFFWEDAEGEPGSKVQIGPDSLVQIQSTGVAREGSMTVGRVYAYCYPY